MTTEIETEVPAVPVPEVVEFSPAQQEKLNEILKKAMGRAGADARAETAALKVENQRLKQVAAGKGSADEVEKIRGELASARLEADALREQHITSQRDLLIAAQGAAFHDLDTLQKLTRGNIKHTDAGFVVVDDAGQPKTNADGTPTSITEFFSDFATKKPWLARGVVKSGGGGTSSSGTPAPIDIYAPETLWGPNARPDAGRVLNEWSLRDKRGYDQARKSAVAKGLVN
jgi:hypothetical protein